MARAPGDGTGPQIADAVRAEAARHERTDPEADLHRLLRHPELLRSYLSQKVVDTTASPTVSAGPLPPFVPHRLSVHHVPPPADRWTEPRVAVASAVAGRYAPGPDEASMAIPGGAEDREMHNQDENRPSRWWSRLLGTLRRGQT